MELTPAGVLRTRVFNQLSDRDGKDQLQIDSAEILRRLESLPIQRWSFKDESTVQHIGPMGPLLSAGSNDDFDEGLFAESEPVQGKMMRAEPSKARAMQCGRTGQVSLAQRAFPFGKDTLFGCVLRAASNLTVNPLFTRPDSLGCTRYRTIASSQVFSLTRNTTPGRS